MGNIYHQHGAQVDKEDQNINFHFAESLSEFQIGNAYLEIEMEFENVGGTNLTKADEVRLLNIAFACFFSGGGGRSTTSFRVEIEQTRLRGSVSTIIRRLARKK